MTAIVVAITTASLMFNQAKAAIVLTVTPQGMEGSNYVYQIDFDPITFQSNSFSNSGLGFIVQDFFNTDPTAFGVASSGAFNVSTTLANGSPSMPSDSSIGGQRGTLGAGTSFGRRDLLVSTGGVLFGFGGPTFNPPTDVTISALSLQFISSVMIPAFDAGDRNAILVDNFGRLLSDPVTLRVISGDMPAPIPVPAALPMLITGLAGLGLALRRKRRDVAA